MKLDKKHIPFFIVGFGLLYAGYTYNGFVSTEVPQMDREWNARNAAVAKKEQELEKLRNFAKNIEVVKLRLRELNLQLEAALETMPSNYDLSGLLRRMAILATNSGVELTSFSPAGRPVRRKDAFYETLDIAFGVKGSFNEGLVFLDQLSRLKRLIKVQSIALSMRKGNQDLEPGAPIPAASNNRIRLYRFVE